MWKRFRKWHWILSLIALLQFCIWGLSGSYMVLTDINFIRGNDLIKTPVNVHPISASINQNFNQTYNAYPAAKRIKLVLSTPTPEVQFYIDDKLYRIDMVTKQPASTIDRVYIKHQVHQWYAHSSAIKDITLLPAPPTEISSRHKSVWKVTFDSLADDTLYFSADSGRLVGKRHNYWRAFDWFWRFHIMDYWEGEDIHNPLLSFFSLVTLLTALFGFSLLTPWVRHHIKKRGQ
ncbi:PepSY domain-containing protein [Shewanella sp. 202IG2-18]|uniref:PepSY domain-containing protein n=1 Tax=Parashewanella hymeniacidonis TaxID=2807618 RepID=UPI00195F77CF|nr:PepSY domain-containing protein [Parashewanella hymeniacidonis]MBM7070974.1 PepSY domain-containing protein [Parashewanella hymeniacidonis]